MTAKKRKPVRAEPVPMVTRAAMECWQDYALHLAHCWPCGMRSVHCRMGQLLRDAAFEIREVAPKRRKRGGT